MKVSPNGLALIKRYEGFRSRPYQDAVGVWTIGYGETRGIGPRTPAWSEAFASQRLKQRVDRDFAPYVNRIGVPLNQNQFDALCSFVYNVGPGGVAPSTGVGRHLRARNYRAAADALLAWNKAGGRVLPGLARRREEERSLFLRPVADPKARKLARWRGRLKRVRASIAAAGPGESTVGRRRLANWLKKLIRRNR